MITQKTQIVIINVCSIFIIFSCIVTQIDTGHIVQTRAIGVHVQNALLSIEDMFEELTSLTNATEVCNARLVNLAHELNNTCEKIRKLEISDVNLSTNRGELLRTIRVDINGSYDECVKNCSCSEELVHGKTWCLRVALWSQNHNNSTADDIAEEALFGSNLNAKNTQTNFRSKRNTRQLRRIAPRDITKPRTGYRIRKEYRTLTPEEREKYHNAVKELYLDGTFSCFALVHRKGIERKGVHKGEAFLPWHRAFLALYEEALRQIEPTVSLPYWDSSIDYSISNPVFSLMWDEHHLGTGLGNVTNGPFANFATDETPLKRDIGSGKGSLIDPRQFNNIFPKDVCKLKDVFRKLEGKHNGVHTWIGGTMKGKLSASDPVFYMHHAFIDYLWEKFREYQRSEECDYIDPSIDYPVTKTGKKPTEPGHMPEEPMDGMEFMINKLGIENFWIENWYGYAERPTCANNCSNSDEMFCHVKKNLCIGNAIDRAQKVKVRQAISLRSQDRRPSSPLSTISTETISSGATANNSICRRQPYLRSCHSPSPPLTNEEIASAMVNKEIPMPDEIARLWDRLQREREDAAKSPPVSEPAFFKDLGVVSNDCRTADTAVYDLLLWLLQEQQIA